MAKVEIYGPTNNPRDVRVFVDDLDITSKLSGLTVNCRAGEFSRVELDLTAGSHLDIILDAKVSIFFTLIPGYVLISDLQPDGKIHYTTTRVDKNDQRTNLSIVSKPSESLEPSSGDAEPDVAPGPDLASA